MKEKLSNRCFLAVTLFCFTLLLSACQNSAVDTEQAAGSAEAMVPSLDGVDFTAAAEKLGVPMEDLTGALGSPPDIAAAAEKLGISESSLMEALGV